MENISKIEEKILRFWDKNKIFEKSVKKRKSKKTFSFYDGPPFATGKPHYGHVLATTIKDTVLRYWTMKGFQVPRRVGWDCHGLPVENLIEKELGIKTKKEIEELGVEKFNKLCRAAVFRHVKDFIVVLKRVGRWADYGNSYSTMDNEYIESVWWVFNQLWKNGLVYRDYRVSPYCPRCETPLSNFEVNQGYKEIIDNSIFIKFKVSSGDLEGSYLLAWTTTPWTLPGNVGLAVDPASKYVQAEKSGEKFIIAEKRVSVLGEDCNVLRKFKGKELTGIKYEPLFDSLKDENTENAFRVLPASFVSMDDGTGIVHTAVMYGVDDFNFGKKFKLPMIHTVDESGKFKEMVKEWAGQFVKDAEGSITENLKERKLLFKEERALHAYPFCWRCDSPLLYYALNTWYIKVSGIRKQLVANNKKINWVPVHIKEGRFGKWLKGAKDWAFSRNRFWGAPIPIWRCKKCDEFRCIGSKKELGRDLKDFHRPYIDKVLLKCKCGGKMERVEEVFDCWFESGSMPYGQWRYPFKNKKMVEKTFPADFIAEGLDQTRGWFYTLHVLATALTLDKGVFGKDQPAFKNAIVNGFILASDGKKLSKRLKNYPETSEVFDNYGADSLRYFLLSSTPIGEDYLFSSKVVEDIYRKVISTFWHTLVFFETYKKKDFIPRKNFVPRNALDKWIISRINSTNKEVTSFMDKYELTKGARPFADLIDDISNWYVRRSRRRFQKPENANEKEEASQVLHYCLFSLAKMMAPFTPFLSEYAYLKLRKNNDPESVHLCDYPRYNEKMLNKALEGKMAIARNVVASALAERSKLRIRVRQPLLGLTVKNNQLRKDAEIIELIKKEINVKKVLFDSKSENEIYLDGTITPELKKEGLAREIIRQIKDARKKSGLTPKDRIVIFLKADGQLKIAAQENEEEIKKETFAVELHYKNLPGNYKDFLIEGMNIAIVVKKYSGRDK